MALNRVAAHAKWNPPYTRAEVEEYEARVVGLPPDLKSFLIHVSRETSYKHVFSLCWPRSKEELGVCKIPTHITLYGIETIDGWDDDDNGAMVELGGGYFIVLAGNRRGSVWEADDCGVWRYRYATFTDYANDRVF
jgi:hypothetical protein